MEKLLTVLIQTSPLPSHPSTALLEALFRSFDRVDGLKEANIIILADGCESEETTTEDDHNNDSDNIQKANFKHGSAPLETRSKYKQHLQLLKEMIDEKQPPFNPLKKGTIQLLELPYRHGSARAIAAAFNERQEIVSTPYVLIGQHDNFFVRDVSYLTTLVHYMEEDHTKSWLKCVHFPSTATLNYATKVKRRYDLDISNVSVDLNNGGGSFIPLVFWYGRTHLARTSYYTSFILKQFPNLQVSDHLEELFGTVQLNELHKIKGRQHNFEDEFRRVHEKYGNYVFFDKNNPEEQTEVLYHMSGRKVRAATTNYSTPTEQELPPQTSQDTERSSSNNTSFTPHANSFTTARRSIASVPGLEFVTLEKKNGSSSSKTPPKRFKQNCFHCGKKGHSFKFCPAIKEENGMPSIDVLQI
jgi:hypothetical protein